MKNYMKKTIGKSLLSDFEFENLIIRIECVLNSRPLTSVSDDSLDVIRAVDFLQPRVPLTFNDLYQTEYERGGREEKFKHHE